MGAGRSPARLTLLSIDVPADPTDGGIVPMFALPGVAAPGLCPLLPLADMPRRGAPRGWLCCAPGLSRRGGSGAAPGRFERSGQRW